MAAQNAHENTEEIIDLTELIEKGEVPANTEAASVDDDQSGLHTHMRSLNEEGRQADAEIDDLLAQMEARDDSENAPNLDGMPLEALENTNNDSATTPQTHEFASSDLSVDPHGRIVDPNEKLHMPGMGDVDTLLNFLDIPPQPAQRGAEAASPHSVDDAVDQMLNGLTGAACPSTARPEEAASDACDHAPDVDDLLAAGTVPEPVLSDELEALFNTSEKRPSAQAQSAADDNGPALSPEPAQEADAAFNPGEFAADLASLLANDSPASTAGADQGAAAKAHSEELDFDLDSVLAAADAEIRESAQPMPDMPDMADSPAPQAAPNAEQDAEQGADLRAEQDAEHGAAQTVTPPQQTAQAASEDVKEPSANVAQATAEVPAQPEPEGVAQPKADLPQPAAPGEVPDFAQGALPDMDIDALLAQVTGDITAADPLADATEADSLPARPTEETPPAAQARAGAPGEGATSPEAADGETMADDMGMATAASTARGAEAAHVADAAKTAEAAVAADATETPDTADAAVAQSAAISQSTALDADAASSHAPALAAVAQRLEQCEDLLRQAEDRVSALESAVAEAREAAEQAHALADEAREAAGLAQASAEEAQNTARAVGKDAANAADEALQAARHAQEAAEAAMQQNNAPDAAHALAQTLFEPGHPLHQRLMDAIQAAAAEAAQEAAQLALQEAAQQALQTAAAEAPAAPGEAPALAERLDSADLMLRGASARLDSIEVRLDDLEPRFNDQVEKSAAAAAARILREEIARLLESEIE